MNRLMLKPTSVLVLLVWVISIAAPLARPANVWASDAPSACATAESACTEFENEDEWVATICKDPDPMPSNVTVAEYEASKASCKENAKLAWGQVGPSCEVIEFAGRQIAGQNALAVTYAVISALAFVAFALQSAGVTSAAGTWMAFVVGIAAGLAGAADLLASATMKKDAKEALGGVTEMDVIGGLAGVVVGAVGSGLSAGKDFGNLAGRGNVGTKGTPIMTLITGITTGALSAMKFGSASSNQATLDSACQIVAGQASNVLTLSGTTLLPDMDTGSGTSAAGNSENGAGVASSSALGSEKRASDGFKKMISSPEAFAAAAATAGRLDPKLGEFFKKVPPKDLFNNLKSVRPGFDKVAAAVAQGNFSGVSAALGGPAASDKKLAGALDAADKEFKKRMAALRAQEVQGTQYAKGKGGQSGSSASKGKAGAGTNPFAGLMGGAGGGGDGPDALKFTGGPAAPTQAPADAGDPNDLFHAQERGTLFDIVSRRVGRTRDRVEAYEWDSPINRLIENLPHKAADEPLRKPAGKRAP